jgi:hypothetical protein
MGVLVNIDDFKGDLAVSTNRFNDLSFQSFIEEQEVYFTYLIIGEDLGELVLANQSNPDYEKLILPFSFQRGRRVYQSYGLKKTVALFIRSIWLSKVQSAVTIAGAGKGTADNTDINNVAYFIGWNDAVKSAKGLQQYCLKNKSKYSEFQYTDLTYNHYS